MGLLDNKISRDDIERVNDIRHHPQYEAGFDDMGGDDMGISDSDFDLDDFDSLFEDDSSDAFGGDSSSGGFGSGSFGSDGFGGGGFGGGGFGSNDFGSSFGNNGFGSSFGGNSFDSFNGNTKQSQEEQQGAFDKAVDVGIETAKSIGIILKEMLESVKLRNADDYGYLSRNLITYGGILIPVSVVLGIIGVAASIKFLSFSGISTQLILCGALSVGIGLTGMGAAALVLCKQADKQTGNTNDLPEIPSGEDNFINDYEDNLEEEISDLFDDDEFDNLFSDDSNENIDNNRENDDDVFSIDTNEVEPDIIDFKAELSNIKENTYMTREVLFNTFKQLFPANTPKFAVRKEIEVDSDEFRTLETMCLKALANIANCELEAVNSQIEKAEETFFSYEIRLKRFNKVKKTDDLAKEIEFYMRKDDKDVSVNATVSIEGDFYKIVVTKGISAIITFGDIFKQDYCCDFFLNEKNKLPIITGIDELGNVILDDAKIFDSMLIAGKPRSGKSWYVLSILASLMLFNTPEDVQFIIVDPKKSNLFKTIALMPHVCGLHDDSQILGILDDIIEIEAPRRKKILEDHRCDDIWAVRKKGVKLPVLYVIVDEYITVLNNLEKDNQKEFNVKIQTLISQFPSLGIRLLVVPHRSTGIVDKTNRTMLQFTAAVRSDIADVKDTLGIDKWTRALIQPGDIAIKTASLRDPIYVRGAALTTDDGDNTIFIETAAKAFYKMGVVIPDMSMMRIACNRDEEYIKSELAEDGNKIQYNYESILEDIK